LYSDYNKKQVQQGSVLGPFLYLLYTFDVPQTANAEFATIAGDIAAMAVGKTIEEAADQLQQTIDAINSNTKKWRAILNDSKSVHVNFTSRKVSYTPIKSKVTKYSIRKWQSI
jgi:hypothetical protein